MTSIPLPPSEPPPPCDCAATFTALHAAHPSSFPSRTIPGDPPTARHGPYLHHARYSCPTCGARWDAVLHVGGFRLG
jgi:hypothetical protein